MTEAAEVVTEAAKGQTAQATESRSVSLNRRHAHRNNSNNNAHFPQHDILLSRRNRVISYVAIPPRSIARTNWTSPGEKVRPAGGTGPAACEPGSRGRRDAGCDKGKLDCGLRTSARRFIASIL
jgi:hypothetical protein